MPSPRRPSSESMSLPATATALALLLVGCAASKPPLGTPFPKAVEQTGQPKTAIDGLQGQPVGLAHQEPIPTDEAAGTAGNPAGASATIASIGGTPATAGSSAGAVIKAPQELAASAAAAAAAALPPGEKFDEGNPTHRLARCRAHMARSEWFDAIGDCRKASELDTRSAEPYIELMRIYVTIQSYADGADAARQVLARDPNSGPAYYYLGWSLSSGQDYPPAIEALQKAVSLDPKRIEYQQGLGMTYALSDNYAKAITTLEQAQTLNPMDTKTKDLLSETRALLAQHLESFEKAVKAKPADPTTRAMLGGQLQKYGFAEKALAEYDAALAKIPNPLADQSEEIKRLAAELYYNRGVLYRDLGRPDMAAPAFQKSLEIEPALAPQAWYFLGRLAYDGGDNDGAIQALRKSVAGAPNVVENRTALALAYDKAGKTDAAKEQRDAIAKLKEQAAAPAAAKAVDAVPEASGGKP